MVNVRAKGGGCNGGGGVRQRVSGSSLYWENQSCDEWSMVNWYWYASILRIRAAISLLLKQF